MQATYETSPPPDHRNATPSDGTTYNPPFRAIVVGTSGDLVVTSLRGVDATYKVQAGQTVIIIGTKIKAATTAGSLVVQF